MGAWLLAGNDGNGVFEPDAKRHQKWIVCRIRMNPSKAINKILEGDLIASAPELL